MEVNRKLIEKHLSSLLDEPVRVEFESVPAAKPAGLSHKTESVMSPESSGALKSAMQIFGGKITR